MVGGGRPLLPEILGQPAGAKAGFSEWGVTGKAAVLPLPSLENRKWRA